MPWPGTEPQACRVSQTTTQGFQASGLPRAHPAACVQGPRLRSAPPSPHLRCAKRQGRPCRTQPWKEQGATPSRGAPHATRRYKWGCFPCIHANYPYLRRLHVAMSRPPGCMVAWSPREASAVTKGWGLHSSGHGQEAWSLVHWNWWWWATGGIKWTRRFGLGKSEIQAWWRRAGIIHGDFGGSQRRPRGRPLTTADTDSASAAQGGPQGISFRNTVSVPE